MKGTRCFQALCAAGFAGLLLSASAFADGGNAPVAPPPPAAPAGSAEASIHAASVGIGGVAVGQGSQNEQGGGTIEAHGTLLKEGRHTLVLLNGSLNQDVTSGPQLALRLRGDVKAGVLTNGAGVDTPVGVYGAVGLGQDYAVSFGSTYRGNVNVALTAEAGLSLKNLQGLKDVVILLSPIVKANVGGSTYGSTTSVSAGGQLLAVQDKGSYFGVQVLRTVAGSDQGGSETSVGVAGGIRVYGPLTATLSVEHAAISDRDAKATGVILAGQDISDNRISAGVAFGF